MIKNIVFDFNGTILDDVDVSFEALNACVEKFINPNNIITKEYYLDTFSFPVRPYYEKIGFDFTKINYSLVSDYFIAYYSSHNEECKLSPHVKELLDYLHKKGIHVVILTASYRPLITAQLSSYGILEEFDDIIAFDNKFAGSKVDSGKEYFLKHPINKDETIMIGDTIHDYEVAKELGFKAVSYCHGHNSRKLLEEKTKSIIIDSLTDIINIFNI
jgi:phosphoglycolate phosphatase